MSTSDGQRAVAATDGATNGATIRVAARLDQLAAVRQFIRRAAGQAGVDRAAVHDIVQAVDESVTNTILHGYRQRKGEVEVVVDRDGASLVVRLRDRAPAFDPTSLPIPDLDLPPGQRRMRGMGVLLTREMMDSVTYRHTIEGNELTLVKECITEPGRQKC